MINRTYIYLKNALPLMLLALVGCNHDDDNASSERLPITFSCYDGGAVTRAGEVGLSEFITDFKVYGINGDISGSGDEATFTKRNTVFPNYQVWHTENMANTTSSNTSNWEYVGNVETAMGTEEQTIKYWDDKHDGHYFWAIGDYSKGGGFDTSNDIPTEIVVNNLKKEDLNDDRKCLYFTKPMFVPSAEYGKPVKLSFMRYCSQIRIGFYEDVVQSGDTKIYDVTSVKFYKVKEDGTFNTNESPTPNVWLKGDYVDECNVKLSYTYGAFKGGDNVDNVTTETVVANDAKSNMMNFGELNIVGTASGKLPISSSQALFTTNNGSQYTRVMPYSNTTGLTLMCDIVVRSGSTQNTLQYVMASIPAHYTNWQPNQSYTYIFKIVAKPDGIAMVLGNVEVNSWTLDASVEAEWHNW